MLAESAYNWFFKEKDPKTMLATWDFATLCTTFFLGGAAGAFATPRLNYHALWVPIALLLVVGYRVRSGAKDATA
jgi:uncharacterized membrane protein YoaK (UPF0700 family)